MRKPVLPRIAGLVVLYTAVFIVLVFIQFTKQRSFTRRVDLLTVSGRTGSSLGNGSGDEYFLEGGASVFFGGMEFLVGGGGEGLALRRTQGYREKLLTEKLVIREGAAVFSLPRGAELSFTVSHTQGGPELRITAVFGEDASALELPYRPMRASRIRDERKDDFIVLWEGISYRFSGAVLDTSRRLLFLEEPGAAVTYGVVPDKRDFSLTDYLMEEGAGEAQYREALARWRTGMVSLWGANIWQSSPDEDLIAAYMAESVNRGTYHTALNSVPLDFKRRKRWGFRSAVYFGALEEALRSLTAFERDLSTRMAALIREGSLEFLKEYRFIEYCAVRGYDGLIEEGAALIRELGPEARDPALTPGILEGYVDWSLYRPGEENPFEVFIENALALVAAEVRREKEGKVFTVLDTGVDTEFNLRLGLALDNWGTMMEQRDWAALGRSLVLSCLALAAPTGDFPQVFSLTGAGDISERDAPRLNAARFYRYLPVDSYPRAVRAQANGVWAWTGAQALWAERQNNVLDITVTFPVGESHYMLIRGIQPFTRIRVYDLDEDYRSDPQFETYDSPGYVYNAAEQTLLLKMRQKIEEEHVRIFF